MTVEAGSGGAGRPAAYPAHRIRADVYGQHVDGKPSDHGKPRDLVDPATGTAFARWVEADPTEVEAAVAAAHRAFVDGRWRRMPVARRAEVMDKVASALRAAGPDLVALDCVCTGKVFAGAVAYDAYEAHNAFSMGAAWLRRHADEVRRSTYPPTLLPAGGPTILNLLMDEPVGVVAELLPWNAPLFTGCERVAAALTAGCSIVAKPSEESPCSFVELAGLLEESGLPPGVFNVVLGGEGVGTQLIDDPRVDLVSLTGSVETGIEVAVRCARHLKRSNLELGGKAPVIVFSDVDVAEVALWASMAAFVNMGEVCVAGTRLLVEDARYDEFVAAVAEAAGRLVIGDPFDEATFIGPLVSAQHAGSVRGFVDRAVGEGSAVVVGGGSVPPGLSEAYVAPVVLGELKPGSELEQHEVFGPVLAAQRFTDEEDAIAKANSTRYGLSASVFSGSVPRALRVAERLEVGNVTVNAHFFANTHIGRGTPRRKSGTSLTGVQSYLAPRGVDVNLGR